MIARREGHFAGQSGIDLFYQSWTPQESGPRPTLVVTHGFAEHSECYRFTAEALAGFGWTTCAWDLQGHGRSEGKRGYVQNFRDYVEDFACFLAFLKAQGIIEHGCVLVGHSMGGLITLSHLLRQRGEPNPKPVAVALSSPQLGLSLPIPPVKDFAAKILNRVLPTVTLYNELKYTDLTHDPEFLKGYAADPLRHDKISPAVYLGMVDDMAYVRDHAPSFQYPLLIQAAGQDRIVSLPDTERFFARAASRQKQLLIYKESYHEIFNDIEREKVFSDLNKFLVQVTS